MFRYLLYTLIGLLALSCNNDDEIVQPPMSAASVILSFQPLYDGLEMDFNSRYNNVHDCTFQVQSMKFYLSNITLHKENGDSLMLSDIELIDFTAHHHTLEYDLSGGDYSSISFDLGVPAALNGTQNPEFMASVYSLDHPLSASNGTYWTWTSGYRFFMLEGRFDTIPNYSNPWGKSFAFHTGTDTLFRHIGTFNRAISGQDGAHTHLQFALDFEKFWSSDAVEIDLRQERDFHGSATQMELGMRLAHNTGSLFRLLP
jgi:hypothetical protein